MRHHRYESEESALILSGKTFYIVLAIVISLDLLLVSGLVKSLSKKEVVQIDPATTASSSVRPVTTPLPPPTPLKGIEL